MVRDASAAEEPPDQLRIRGAQIATTSRSLRCTLADQIAAQGSLADPTWRTAVESTPRETFLGSVLFRFNGTAWEPLRRDQVADDEWLRLAYQDQTWVTQVDGVDAADAHSPVTGEPTSSSTLPSLVVRMLELADITGTDNVLEIGTGTGYSTAILTHRLGNDRVTSIEYDPSVAERAAEALRQTGHAPTLVVADGLQGHRPGAPYDALIATCRLVPGATRCSLSGVDGNVRRRDPA